MVSFRGKTYNDRQELDVEKTWRGPAVALVVGHRFRIDSCVSRKATLWAAVAIQPTAHGERKVEAQHLAEGIFGK